MSVTAQHSSGSQCCCLRELAEERYLSVGGSPESLVTSQAKSAVCQRNSISPDNDAATDNEQLMHVLITKPQAAYKPKDNIIFEGDMDLKTTFETTYEALAKMRLECWKKYQEAHPPTAQTQASVSPKNCCKQVSFEQTTTSGPPELIPQQASELKQQEQIHAAQATQTGAQTSAKASSETSAHQMQTGAQVVERQTAPSIMSAATPVAQVGYVDPDLASIMVYNSNLDRLEKVGSRKRSKHRPLTSLRPGARGFFGNPEETEPNSRQSPSQPVVELVTANEGQKNKAGGPLAREAQLAEHQPSTSYTSDADPASQQPGPQPEPTIYNLGIQQPGQQSVKLNARNLTNSSQPLNSLFFSDENLPVDSKRKVRNNVNMIDHIRDQNIIESHYSTKAAPLAQTNTLHCNQPKDQHQEQLSKPDRKLQHQSEPKLCSPDLLLARQEEIEALEEIKKLTSSTHQAQGTVTKLPEVGSHHSQSVMGPATATGSGFPHENDLCRQRLQRTCQHQNFYISDNDYTTYLDQPSDTHSPPTFQQQYYNNNNINMTPTHLSSHHHNLFRESPDFILATEAFAGNFPQNADLTSLIDSRLETESRQTEKVTMKQEVELQSPTGDTKEHDLYLNDDSLMNKCKVEELTAYHYVGTKGGHKYFSENNK